MSKITISNTLSTEIEDSEFCGNCKFKSKSCKTSGLLLTLDPYCKLFYDVNLFHAEGKAKRCDACIESGNHNLKETKRLKIGFRKRMTKYILHLFNQKTDFMIRH